MFRVSATSALNSFIVFKDLGALWLVLAFPKFILRATGDPKLHPGLDAANIVGKMWERWYEGSFSALWE